MNKLQTINKKLQRIQTLKDYIIDREDMLMRYGRDKPEMQSFVKDVTGAKSEIRRIGSKNKLKAQRFFLVLTNKIKQ